MYHAIHSFGLAELLKSGAVANVDDEHFWNLIDNTYCDDVSCYHVMDMKSMETHMQRLMKRCSLVATQCTTTISICPQHIRLPCR
jgi:hypothetical protein